MPSERDWSDSSQETWEMVRQQTSVRLTSMNRSRFQMSAVINAILVLVACCTPSDVESMVQ